LRLLGWSIESPIVQTPNFARLTLFWQGNADQAAARGVRAELVDRAGRAAQVIEATVPGLRREEIRRDQLSFWLPPEFQSGTYAVQVKVLDENQQVVDTLNVTSIEVK
jgi:hypothetical protein